MKVFIITEGGINIGFGHITRCLSLYQAFEERGIIPKFIINGGDSIEGLLKHINYQIINWIDEKERNEIFKIVENADIAIIDSYLADIPFYEKLSNLVKIPVYIDDNKRLDYPKGIVLNGNIHAEKLNYPKKGGITYLLGTKYTPLRKEFWDLPEKKIKENIESIMITFGGDDAQNLTPQILKFLSKNYPNFKKNVIIGNAYNNIDDIKKETDKNTNLIYYPNAQKIKKIMLDSNIAISAGGQTLYELVRVGVPTIGICVADNQLESVNEWEKLGFLEYAGWNKENNFIKKINNLLKYLEDVKVRENKYEIGREFVDGKGSFRIIKILLFNLFKKNLTLRKVNFKDALDIFNLSNDDVVRKNSFNSEKIKWENHLIWLKKKLENENSIYFVVADDLNKFYGQVRFDINPKNEEAIINISLGKNIRGLGLSSFIIDKSINELLKIKSLKLIKAYIKYDNIPSIKSFKRANFIFLDNQIIKGNKSKVYIRGLNVC